MSLTADIFAAWINTDLLPSADLPPDFPKTITPRTARRWLHSLGFSPTPYKKGVYYDGHERDDVEEYRRIYLRKLEILQSTHLPPPICPDGEIEETIGAAGAEKRLVLLYHDESSFHSNEGRTWQWTEKDKLSLHPKGQGRGLMVSDFIDEYCGFYGQVLRNMSLQSFVIQAFQKKQGLFLNLAHKAMATGTMNTLLLN